jgi:hypothetical protein
VLVELLPVRKVTKFAHAMRVPLAAWTTMLRLPMNASDPAITELKGSV